MNDTLKAPRIFYHFEAFKGRRVREAQIVSIFGLPIFKRKRLVVPDEPLWQETIGNLVTTVGKSDLLDKYLAGSSYSATWFIGLIDNASYSAIAAGDTMSSHAGWIENVEYDEAARPAVSWSAASGGVKAASAACVFTIDPTGAVIKGAFMNSVTTKGGTTGTLYSASAFAANRTLVDDDVLRVTPTMTIT